MTGSTIKSMVKEHLTFRVEVSMLVYIICVSGTEVVTSTNCFLCFACSCEGLYDNDRKHGIGEFLFMTLSPAKSLFQFSHSILTRQFELITRR